MVLKKTNSANLENKRTIFLEIGLIISLVLVLSAFNWRTYDKQVMLLNSNAADDIPTELVPVTVQKPPEPPKIHVPLSVITINIVDDETFLDDDFRIDAEIDPMDTVPIYIPLPALEEEENPGEEEIFTVVESMPEFPGGEAALYAYLSNNMTYPIMAREAGIKGKVYLTFVVEKDGTITDVKVMRGIGGGCDEEALRVIKSMPTWTPGKQRNVPVRVQFSLDIRFTLSGL